MSGKGISGIVVLIMGAVSDIAAEQAMRFNFHIMARGLLSVMLMNPPRKIFYVIHESGGDAKFWFH